MQHPDYSAIGKVMELIDESPRLHRLAWALVLIGLLFGAAAVISAIRWW